MTNLNFTQIYAWITEENETEVSFFNRQLYEQFKLNPQVSYINLLHESNPMYCRLVGIERTCRY